MRTSIRPGPVVDLQTPLYLSVSPFGIDGLAEGVRIARAVGCAGVDANVSLFPGGERPAELAEVPVAVVSVSWQSLRRVDLARCVGVARRVGAHTLNVYPTLAPGDEPKRARAALLADLRAALDASGTDGPGLTLENALERSPGLASAFDDWRRILEEVGSPRLRGTLDAANFVASGDRVSPARIAEEAGALIGYVHVKGVVPFDSGLQAREPFRRAWEGVDRWLAAPAGEGVPDYAVLLPLLLNQGYKGAIGIEPFAVEPPIRAAVACVRRVLSEFNRPREDLPL
jgi:sugar phosphate isomerase/epimerase